MTKKKAPKKVALGILSASVAIPAVLMVVPNVQANDVILETTLTYKEPVSQDIKFTKSLNPDLAGFDFGVTEDGSIYTWNTYSGTTKDKTVAEKVGQMPDIAKMWSNKDTFYALNDAGELYTWGKNVRSKTGHPKEEDTSLPKKLEGLPKIETMYFSFYGDVVFALTTEGEVYSWGTTNTTLLGNNSDGSKPTKLEGLTGVTNIEFSTYTIFATTESNDVYAWGDNEDGIAGVGLSSSTIKTPTKVLAPKIKKLYFKNGSAFALTEDGSAYAWGSGLNEVFGDGTSGVERRTPKKIEGIPSAKSLHMSSSSVHVITEDGRVFGWGDRDKSGTGVERTTPVELTSLSALKIKDIIVKDTTVSSKTLYAITETGEVYSWGNNQKGVAGVGTTSDVTTPTKVPNLSNVKEIHTKSGASVAYAITESGDMYAWGGGSPVQGHGDSTQRTTPAKITGLSGIAEYYEDTSLNLVTFVKTTDNKFMAWGSASDGSLGLGSNTANKPQQISVGNVVSYQRDTNPDKIGNTYVINSEGGYYAWGTKSPFATNIATKIDKVMETKETDVIFSKVSDTTTKIKISPVPGATNYKVVLNDAVISNGKSTEVTVDKLVKGLSYDIKLEVTTPVGIFTTDINYLHESEVENLGSPENLEINRVGYDSADISWSPVNGAEKYVVTVGGKVVYTGSDSSVVLTDLVKGKDYEVVVSTIYPYTPTPIGGAKVTLTTLDSAKVVPIEVGDRVRIGDNYWHAVAKEVDGSTKLLKEEAHPVKFAWGTRSTDELKGVNDFFQTQKEEIIGDPEISGVLKTFKFETDKIAYKDYSLRALSGISIETDMAIATFKDWLDYKHLLKPFTERVSFATAFVVQLTDDASDLYTVRTDNTVKAYSLKGSSSNVEHTAIPIIYLPGDYSYKLADNSVVQVPLEKVKNLSVKSFGKAARISWDAQEYAVGYEIKRTGLTKPITLDAETTIYDDISMIDGLPYTFTVTALYANGKRSESIALTVKSGENVSTEDEEMKPTTPPAGEGKPDGEGKPESDGKPDGEGKPEGEGEEKPAPTETVNWSFTNSDAKLLGAIPNITVAGSKAVEGLVVRNIVWVEKETTVTTDYGDIVLKPDGKGGTLVSIPKGLGTKDTDKVINVEFEGTNFLDITIISTPKLNFKTGKK